MRNQTIATIAIPGTYRIPFFLALIAAGLAGNYYNFEIFLNINFLFGSIFAMLALQFYGFGRGVAAAIIIASYTYSLWNHPYAIIIMTAEIAAVHWLMGRRKIGMVLADALYWLMIGIPLIYLFYHVVMHVPPSNTYIVMSKQAVNGIANTLIARLLFIGYSLRSRSSLISLKEIVYSMLALFVLCPTLILLAIGSRTEFAETDRQIRFSLDQSSQSLNHYLEAWIKNRMPAIDNLAKIAASRSPRQMQFYVEMAKESDTNFMRVGLLDEKAISLAFMPRIDERGKSTIGVDFSDRPYIPIIRRHVKPMLSDVFMGHIGTSEPRVLMMAPVVIAGQYKGLTLAVLTFQQIKEQLDIETAENHTLYTLLDKNGNVILTNRSDQKIFKPFVPVKGILHRLDKRISQIVPDKSPNTPISECWRKSFYIAETAIGDLAEWKLILEQPVAPFQKMLYDKYTGKLTVLFFIVLVALALAELFSRSIVGNLGQLRALSHELPDRLVADCKEIVWPESGIEEIYHLINNFSEMADSLSLQFSEIIMIKESLEWRVQERTAQLDITNTELMAEIAERKLVEAELHKSNEAAEAASIAKSQFLSTISHEIRTPLSSMLGNIELLEGSHLAPYQQNCLNDCKSASQMLLQVINDVLDYSKIEAGKLELVNEAFSISSMSRQLIRMFSAAAKKGALDLSIELADDLPEYISGDEQRLRQILSNLLSNAIKFTRCGGVTLRISREQTTSSSVRSDNAVLTIVVSDTGIGIPIEKHDLIFDRFTQVEDFNTRTATGTGLGLPICRHLLALMGGSITVSSVTGAGSSFTVVLPVTISRPPINAPFQARSHANVPSRKILLADDDEFGRTVAQKLLQLRGYMVTTVENGTDLLAALQTEEFEIVLTDISMPDMDGTRVARIIRSGERPGIDPDIPIIAMTAHAFASDGARFLAAGINGYVAKPINLEDLFRQIEELCGKERSGESNV